MTAAWRSSYPSGKKMVLLALCDNANDQGECFPSVQMLAEKCSMSERSVFNHIAELSKDGAVQRNVRAGRSTVYFLDPCKFCTPTPANSAPPPLQRLHPTPATVAYTPATVAPITITQSSSNQIPNTKDKSLAPLVLPDWIPSESWNAFLQTRKKKRAADTPFAVSLILKDLIKFRAGGHDIEDILNKSIKNGWTDVYEPKAPSKQFSGKPAESFAERDERHARERYEEATGKRSRTVIDITPSTELLERLQ